LVSRALNAIRMRRFYFNDFDRDIVPDDIPSPVFWSTPA
jgi:hypothetical protein